LSLWQWSKLPEYKSPRYVDYARANASIGINGAVLNNVNADPRILTEQFLKKAAAIADVFRPYGIKVYFSANFYAPKRIGGLDTADPMDPKVRKWWKQKVNQIYKYIPDFGGFLVKANSEGQPGPADYNRTQAQGANVMAEALKPHGGIVMWRAFVYNAGGEDRAKQAYDKFVPLDGKFDDNVIVQVKNGPIDFQPREPFHPLFGALKRTNTMMELQITQEYFGFSNHLAYLGPLYEEVLDSDTYAKGKGSTVAKVIEGQVYNYNQTGIAGVANTGNDINWTGHPFGQANWFVFGRLAWDPTQSSEDIADDWIRMTFTNNEKFIKPVKGMMMKSREAGVKYREPLGLAHLCIQGQHYGPAPWTKDMPRPDWTAVYYHRADSVGIGFDRTQTGSNAVEQYNQPIEGKFRQLKSTPDKLLLWFHHVPWDYKMNSGRTLWQELVHQYYKGVDMVRNMQKTWDSVEGLIDEERYQHVKALLKIQEKDAVWWRNACVLYFQTFSNRPIPDQYEKPAHTLEYYKKLEHTKYYEHN
ncbi:MAG TPA: alpha-glucuronidase, partial [Balneolaceae bacterium]|nr:alpha-glucuronidase [Balneolaceae bacterium]